MKRRYYWVISVGALVSVWFIVSEYGLVGRTLIATPSEVVGAVERAMAPGAPKSERFQVHAYYTIRRAVHGWLFGIGIGLGAGILAGGVLWVFLVTEPLVEFARAVPPILAFPLLLVAFNYSEQSYIWTIAFGCSPVMMLTVARGSLGISKTRMELLRVYDVGVGHRLLARVMEILPSVFLGARLSLAIALIVAVVTEMVFTPRSGWALGALARDAEIDFDTPLFYASVLSVGIFGYLSNWMMRKLEERLGFTQMH